MFKRLKRIEALLTEIASYERECLEITKEVRARWQAIDIKTALHEALPFKCPVPGCAVVSYHVHTIVELPPPAEGPLPNSGEVK